MTDLQVLVVGGGIHGVGLLHDLASRGLTGLLLAEQGRLASGTSSRSTKLLHGGLRYLEHAGQWGLVREALRERTLLGALLGAEARPLPIVLPCLASGRPPWMVRTGLWLYDRLAGASPLPPPRRLSPDEAAQVAPYLRPESLAAARGAFLYHDLQMRDDAVVRLVAEAARRLGAEVAEHTAVRAVEAAPGGFRAELAGPGGRRIVTARAVVNAAGAWTGANLLRWGFAPRVVTALDVGSHLLFSPRAADGEPDRSAGTLVQHDDGRVVFFLPWFGRWLLGTTESLLAGDPAGVAVSEADRDYLLAVARGPLGLRDPEAHLEAAFAGVRTMPLARAPARTGVEAAWRRDPFASPYYLRAWCGSLAAASREAVVEESAPGLLSLYGGKFTTYRAQCERLGNRLAARLGVSARSRTASPAAWFLDEIRGAAPGLLATDPTLWGG